MSSRGVEQHHSHVNGIKAIGLLLIFSFTTALHLPATQHYGTVQSQFGKTGEN